MIDPSPGGSQDRSRAIGSAIDRDLRIEEGGIDPGTERKGGGPGIEGIDPGIGGPAGTGRGTGAGTGGGDPDQDPKRYRDRSRSSSPSET